MTRTEAHQPHAAGGTSTTRRRVRGAAAIGAAAIVLVLAAACSSGPTSAPATSAPAPTAPGGTGTAASISISNYKFVPDTLRVAPGEKVTVTNHDSVAHTVTSASGKFDTGNIQPGASMTFAAPTKSGSFPYICSIHQFMSGTVTVT